MTRDPIYTAEATVTGGRDAGHGHSADGALDVDLRVPKEMGGPGEGTNPEQLFAVGFAACFESALKLAARRMKTDADDVRIDSKVSLVPAEDRGFDVAVTLDVTLPSQQGDEARQLVENAHKWCPYSRATRGNIGVALSVNGESL